MPKIEVSTKSYQAYWIDKKHYLENLLFHTTNFGVPPVSVAIGWGISGIMFLQKKVTLPGSEKKCCHVANAELMMTLNHNR